MKSSLSTATQKAYDAITKRYVISSDGLLVLRAALEAFDDYTRARALVCKEGLIGGDGKRHPAHDIQVNSYRNFLAGIRHLGLDAQPDELAELDAEAQS
ncbi:MAG TPA: hypothetical protein VEB03_01935 [Candidatus Nanoarchaeia archaeon]|nr:hypothetical protein [Candidatus Nanoarchaeia archaeon]